MSLLPNLSALATGVGAQDGGPTRPPKSALRRPGDHGHNVPQRREQKDKVTFNPPPNSNPDDGACQYKVCGDATRVQWSLKLDEVYSAEMLVRYQTPLPEPFAASGHVPGQWELYPYFSTSRRQWEAHPEIAHPSSFRTVIAKQNLMKADSEGNMGAVHSWETQSEFTKAALNRTLWREEPVYEGKPKAAPAGSAGRCRPVYCLMPMDAWVERAAKLTATDRANDRLFRLMDGYCHLMNWTYRLYDSAAATLERKLSVWYEEAGRAVQLLESYLPVMLESVARLEQNSNLTQDELEWLLVTKHADCGFSKTTDQLLPSQLIQWLIESREALDKHFEARKQGQRDPGEGEDQDGETQDNTFNNTLLFWVPPPPVVRRRE